jgi:mannan endo-1,4-beta-mannosidase
MFSRRQILQLGGNFVVGAVATSAIAAPLLAKSTKVIKKTTLHTKGRFLYDVNGNKIILRGLNFPLLDDWDFPRKHSLNEFAKTGANVARIQWYRDYGQAARPEYSLVDLDKFITECRNKKIIPMVYLNDVTCKEDSSLLISKIMPWWTSPEVIAMLARHQKYIIINLANELGDYRDAKNPQAALNSYTNSYKTAIAMMRRKIKSPIVIDAPDCGGSIEVFLKVGKELLASDPERNLLFSVHSYWSSYNGMSFIQRAIDANLPLIFGEVANKEDKTIKGKNQFCYYGLDRTGKTHPAPNGFYYQQLLTMLQQKEIGWMAWAWWKDGCSDRQITRTGTMTGLTPYGKDIIYNSTYGLKAKSKIASRAF